MLLANMQFLPCQENLRTLMRIYTTRVANIDRFASHMAKYNDIKS